MGAYFRGATSGCLLQRWHGCSWLPYDEKNLLTFSSQKGDGNYTELDAVIPAET